MLYFYAHVVTNMLRALAMTGRFQFEDSGSLCCYAHVVTNTLSAVTTTNLTKSSPAWPNLGPRVGAHQRAGRRRHAAGHAPGCMLQFEVFEWPCYYVQGVIDTRQARATTGMVLFEVFESLHMYALGVTSTLEAMIVTSCAQLYLIESLYLCVQ